MSDVLAKKRSAKKADAGPMLDVFSILQRPVKIQQGDTIKSMSVFEANIRSLVAGALRGDMAAAKRFLRECQAAGVFEIPEAEDEHVYSYTVPKGWDSEDWMGKFRELGPPPWPGDRDGLTPLERQDKWTKRKNGSRIR